MAKESKNLFDIEQVRKANQKQRKRALRAIETSDSDAHRFTARARVRLLEGQLKEARIGRFLIRSDELDERGGLGQAPLPLHYLVASVGFCMLSQLIRYAADAGILIEKAEVDVRAEFDTLGKLGIDDSSSACRQFTYIFDISSLAAPTEIRKILQWVDRGCHALNTVRFPVPVDAHLRLNGVTLSQVPPGVDE